MRFAFVLYLDAFHSKFLTIDLSLCFQFSTLENSTAELRTALSNSRASKWGCFPIQWIQNETSWLARDSNLDLKSTNSK